MKDGYQYALSKIHKKAIVSFGDNAAAISSCWLSDVPVSKTPKGEYRKCKLSYLPL